MTHAPEEVHPAARVLFDFSPTSPFELAVRGKIATFPLVRRRLASLITLAGTSVDVLEEDDGSGWVKVADTTGGKGLVPASYIQISDASTVADQGLPAPPESSHSQRVGESGTLFRRTN